MSALKSDHVQSKDRTERSDRMPRFATFDYLRLFAILLVTFQHAMAVTGHYEQTTWMNVNLGQIGVGLFCALSGYLAFLINEMSATEWLKKRLWHIFPAYWIVTIAAFVLTWVAGTKKIDWWLFLSQMLGTGYFTHGWELINVVSWFISLIFLCYIIAFISKWLGAPRIILFCVAILALVLLATRTEVALSRHILTFCVAGIIAQIGPRPATTFLIIATLVGSTLLWPLSVYSILSIAILFLALAWRLPESKSTRILSNYVYEFFLVHGIFLVALTRLIPQSKMLSIAIAVFLAIISAALLKLLTSRIVTLARLHD